MVLVCALVLTVPFGFFQYFNEGFFDLLKSNIDACRASYSEEDFNFDYNRETTDTLNNVITCIMSSLCALIMAVLYYLFKPDPFEMEVFMRRNGNILLCKDIITYHTLIISHSLTHSLTHSLSLHGFLDHRSNIFIDDLYSKFF